MPRSFIKNTEFKEIRTDLKDFLRDPEVNPEFTDMDFEGSNINVIINLLSYVAHHHAVYSNLVLNESFLRTAHTRAATVSRAKDLNYTPRSYTAPTMLVNFTLRNLQGGPSSHTLRRGTKFKSTVDGKEYTFVVTDDVSAANVGGDFVFEDLRLRQGKIRTFRYNITEDNFRDLFEIPDEKVDTSLLLVRVLESSSGSSESLFRRDTNVVKQGRDSKIYYLQEGPNGKFQIEFGDGIISKRLSAGNVVKLNWVSTEGPGGNGISTVRPDFSIAGGYDYDIEVTTPSFGGDEKENIDSIKFTAPKHHAAQNRIVTTDDYYVALKENVGDIRDIKVWGGEDNDPPMYGKVFIVLETQEQIITKGAARDIDERILRPKRMPTAIPEFVNPSYIHPNISVDVIYDATMTSRTRGDILDMIKTEIETFIEDEGRRFDALLYMSELELSIKNLLLRQDDSEDDGYANSSRGNPIRSVTASITLTSIKTVNTNQSINIKYDFGNSIEPGSIESNRFTAIEKFRDRNAKLTDDGIGGMYIFDIPSGQRTSKRVGDVNYEKGIVTITDLRISAFYQNFSELYITANPADKRTVRGERYLIFRQGDYERNVLAGIPNPLEINLSIA